MEERAACAQLKRRFEAAGFRIKEHQIFDEGGVRFDIDGFDSARRVGYEYVTEEAGDGWDVDGDVIAVLAERRQRGELHVLIVDEADAPDAASLDHAIDEFLKTVPPPGEHAAPPQPAPEHAAAEEPHAATEPSSASPSSAEPAHLAATEPPTPETPELPDPAASDETELAASELADEPELEPEPEPAAEPEPPTGKATKPPPVPKARPAPAKATKPPPTPKAGKKKPARKTK